MNHQVHISRNPEEFEKILELRFKVLRAPWNQSKASATDEKENESYNAYILSSEGGVIACGRLQENENKVGQIRYMAVDANWQGKGLGKTILETLETKAKELGFKKIELQARENALEFYKSNKYSIDEKSFLLWGQIQHYKMSKTLNFEP
ncbi:MAG: GNAT family N-acetyltransferase [Bacteroidia bacterium]|nr:GNAT family N-acetyltransferase [Bacteroidia bacterium]